VWSSEKIGHSGRDYILPSSFTFQLVSVNVFVMLCTWRHIEKWNVYTLHMSGNQMVVDQCIEVWSYWRLCSVVQHDHPSLCSLRLVISKNVPLLDPRKLRMFHFLCAAWRIQVITQDFVSVITGLQQVTIAGYVANSSLSYLIPWELFIYSCCLLCPVAFHYLPSHIGLFQLLILSLLLITAWLRWTCGNPQ